MPIAVITRLTCASARASGSSARGVAGSMARVKADAVPAGATSASVATSSAASAAAARALAAPASGPLNGAPSRCARSRQAGRSGPFGAAVRGRSRDQLLGRLEECGLGFAACAVVLPGGIARDRLPLLHRRLVEVPDLGAGLGVDVGGDLVVGLGGVGRELLLLGAD